MPQTVLQRQFEYAYRNGLVSCIIRIYPWRSFLDNQESLCLHGAHADRLSVLAPELWWQTHTPLLDGRHHDCRYLPRGVGKLIRLCTAPADAVERPPRGFRTPY
jgi:hypothetical protein